MSQVSLHITLDEATISPTALRMGIDNTPNEEQLANMKLVAEKCFEPIRAWYGKPLKVNSFFRCEELNKAVKGAPTSQHTKGMAIDFSAGTKAENKKIYDWAVRNLTAWDQVINEYNYTWIHISYNPTKNRMQVLSVGK